MKIASDSNLDRNRLLKTIERTGSIESALIELFANEMLPHKEAKSNTKANDSFEFLSDSGLPNNHIILQRIFASDSDDEYAEDGPRLGKEEIEAMLLEMLRSDTGCEDALQSMYWEKVLKIVQGDLSVVARLLRISILNKEQYAMFEIATAYLHLFSENPENAAFLVACLCQLSRVAIFAPADSLERFLLNFVKCLSKHSALTAIKSADPSFQCLAHFGAQKTVTDLLQTISGFATVKELFQKQIDR